MYYTFRDDFKNRSETFIDRLAAFIKKEPANSDDLIEDL